MEIKWAGNFFCGCLEPDIILYSNSINTHHIVIVYMLLFICACFHSYSDR